MELERLTIRAPIASTVLQVNAKVGELATPASPQPLMSLGDLSALRVRAELDERDVGKIKLGDDVAVRADAFRSREFTGKIVKHRTGHSPRTYQVARNTQSHRLRCDGGSD